MAKLDIRYADGRSDSKALSKTETLSIGSHATSDICIDAKDVAKLHCRITWNKTGYEVVAANPVGVDVNGSMVRHALLEADDILRVGPVDIHIVYADGATSKQRPASVGQAESDAIDLAPLTQVDTIPAAKTPDPMKKPPSRPAKKEAPSAESRRGSSRRSRKKDDEEPEVYDEDLEYFEEEPEYDDEPAPRTASRPRRERPSADDDEFEEPSSRRSASKDESGRLGSIRRRIRDRHARPGDQDTLRSPLVWGLSLFALALLLAAFTFIFINTRELADRTYNKGVEEMEAGQFVPAIGYFDEFEKGFPNHDRLGEVRTLRWKSRILKELDSGTPDWKRGLETVQEFINESMDSPDFQQFNGELVEYGKKIALGAAEAARKSKSRDRLEVARSGAQLVNRYKSEDEPLEELQKEMINAFEKAEAAIVKQETLEAGVNDVATALAGNDTLAALTARRKLLNRYSDLEKDSQITGLLAQILEAEQNGVASEDLEREALTDDPRSQMAKPLSLTHHTRSRNDTASEDRTVFVVAKNSCCAVDSITGDPIWRRVIGIDTPFFPIPVATTVSGLLLFDTDRRELVLLNGRSGELLWRQVLDEDLTGPPLIHDGQIYLSTQSNHLYKINIDSGQIMSRLRFSQRVHSSPALSADREHLILAGNEALLYTVSLRPLACVSVTFVGHQPESIKAPLLTMGTLLLVAENDRLQSTLLRVFDTSDSENPLRQVADHRLEEAVVRDQPKIRGKQLFVTSTGDSIASFTVSDDPNETTLILGPSYKGQSPYDGPVYLLVGPGGEMWMASNALRKFELTTNNIQLDSQELAVGLSTQPIQSLGEFVFLGRNLPYCGAVLFSQADRVKMISEWRTVVGASILAWADSGGDGLVAVGEMGTIVRISAEEILAGGFRHDVTRVLPIREDLSTPIQAVPFSDGRLCVHTGGRESLLWVIGSAGQIEQTIRLEAPLQANPVELPTGIVLPLPGKLRLIQRGQSASKVEDFRSPAGDEAPPRWKHLAGLDENQFLAVNSDHVLARYQFRTEPLAHLAEAAKLSFENPIDVGIAVADGRLFMADAAGKLYMLDALTFRPLAEASLPAAASNDLWVVADQLYVETARNELHCFNAGSSLELNWTVPLEASPLAGPPLLEGEILVVAMQDGEILAIDVATGKVSNRLDLGQPLNLGPRRVGKVLVVPSIDGSLHRIEAVLQTGEQ